MMRVMSAFFIALLLPLAAWAEEATATSTSAPAAPAVSSQSSSTLNAAPGFKLGIELGALTVNGTNFNTIRLQPDFSFGPFGMGLDLNMEWDANGNVRFTEWNSWQAVLSKINYIRWGNKGETVYVKVGGINDFVFANGFIVNRYSNMLNYPSVKKLGVAFDLDFKVAGFETMVDNIFDWDVLGLRGYYRPLISTGWFIVDKLEFGATVAADLDPSNQVPATDQPYNFTDSTGSQPVIAYGADVGLPVVDLPFLKMKTYADFAGIVGKGTGEAVGVGGQVAWFIPYKLEARLLQPNFIPAYFDGFYDSARSTKYQSLDSYTNMYAGWFFMSGVALFDNALITTLGIEGTFETNTKPQLTFNFKLDKKLIKIISADLTYTRKNMTQFGDLFYLESQNSVILLNFSYNVSDSLALVVTYKRTYELDAAGNITPFINTSISTRATF